MRVAKEERIRKETALEALESALRQRGLLRRPRRGTAGWKAIEQAICWWKGDDSWLDLPRDVQDIDLRTATAWRTYRQKGVGVMSKDVDKELLAVWTESLYYLIASDKDDDSSSVDSSESSTSSSSSSSRGSSRSKPSSNDPPNKRRKTKSRGGGGGGDPRSRASAEEEDDSLSLDPLDEHKMYNSGYDDACSNSNLSHYEEEDEDEEDEYSNSEHFRGTGGGGTNMVGYGGHLSSTTSLSSACDVIGHPVLHTPPFNSVPSDPHVDYITPEGEFICAHTPPPPPPPLQQPSSAYSPNIFSSYSYDAYQKADSDLSISPTTSLLNEAFLSTSPPTAQFGVGRGGGGFLRGSRKTVRHNDHHDQLIATNDEGTEFDIICGSIAAQQLGQRSNNSNPHQHSSSSSSSSSNGYDAAYESDAYRGMSRSASDGVADIDHDDHSNDSCEGASSSSSSNNNNSDSRHPHPPHNSKKRSDMDRLINEDMANLRLLNDDDASKYALEFTTTGLLELGNDLLQCSGFVEFQSDFTNDLAQTLY
jgi:hypothetical protein